jgi:hypothetical protein
MRPRHYVTAKAWTWDVFAVQRTARQDRHDGAERRIYFDLKDNGGHITGHIRATQTNFT